MVLLAARKKSVWDFDNLDENGNSTLKKLECKSNACNNRSHCFLYRENHQIVWWFFCRLLPMWY